VALIGVEGLAVVVTPDAILVASKDRAEDVKKVVAQLDAAGDSVAVSHRKVARPCGWYDSVDRGDRFQVKRIAVKPGASISLQKHHHRAEHWIVVKGTAEVTCDGKTFLLAEYQSTYIPIGSVHRLSNPGCTDLEIIEVQSGSYLGEDDIVRLEDVYGRGNDGRSDAGGGNDGGNDTPGAKGE
jgi:mannose-1-phosphate guanylyltransferase/mannose-6-phosphate isomerase